MPWTRGLSLTPVSPETGEHAENLPNLRLQTQPWSHILYFSFRFWTGSGFFHILCDPLIVSLVTAALCGLLMSALLLWVQTSVKDTPVPPDAITIARDVVVWLDERSVELRVVVGLLVFYFYSYVIYYDELSATQKWIRPTHSTASRFARVKLLDAATVNFYQRTLYREYKLGCPGHSSIPLYKPLLVSYRAIEDREQRRLKVPCRFVISDVPEANKPFSRRPADAFLYYPRIFQVNASLCTGPDSYEHSLRVFLEVSGMGVFRRWEERIDRTALEEATQPTYVWVKTYYSIVTIVAYALWYKLCKQNALIDDDQDAYIPPVVTGWIPAALLGQQEKKD